MAKKVKIKGFLSFSMLHELSKNEHSGDTLSRIIGKRQGKVLTPGTTYPTLKKLRKWKLVKWRRKGREKLYFLTDNGKKELSALYKELKQYFKGLKKHI